MNGLIQHLATLADFSFNADDILTFTIGTSMDKVPNNYPSGDKCILYIFDSYDGYNYQNAGLFISKLEATDSSYTLLSSFIREATNYTNPRIVNYGTSLRIQYTDQYSQTRWSDEIFGLYLKP